MRVINVLDNTPNSETVTNKHDKEIPKERYKYPEEQEVIKNLKLI